MDDLEKLINSKEYQKQDIEERMKIIETLYNKENNNKYKRGQRIKVVGEGILKNVIGTFYSDYEKSYVIIIEEPENLKGEELYIPKSKYILEVMPGRKESELF
jgi:hypothetical protein